MIAQLYQFSIGSYVIAEEWNANFRTLKEYCSEHIIAFQDSYDNLAFPNSDLTQVFNAVSNSLNVETNRPYDAVNVTNNKEFYVGPVPAQQQVHIYIPQGLNGESRVIFTLPELMTSDAPILVTYNGVTVSLRDKTADCYVDAGSYPYYNSGLYYVMIHELNGKAQVKLISTGV